MLAWAHTAALLADLGMALEDTGRRRDAMVQYLTTATGGDAPIVLGGATGGDDARRVACGPPEGLVSALRAVRLLLRRGETATPLSALHHLVLHGCVAGVVAEWTTHRWLGDVVWSLNSTHPDTLELAVSSWQHAVALWPDDGATQLRVALGLRALGRLSEALPHARVALRMLGASTNGAGGSATTYASQLSLSELRHLEVLATGGLPDVWRDEVVQVFSRRRASGNDASQAHAAARTAVSAAVAHFLRDLQREYDEFTAAKHMAATSETLASSGQLLEAAEKARAAWQRTPPATAGRLLHMLGRHEEEAGRLKQAVHFYKLALRGVPAFAAAQLDLGRVLALQGRFQGALKVYQDLLVATAAPATSGDRTLASVLTGHAATDVQPRSGGGGEDGGPSHTTTPTSTSTSTSAARHARARVVPLSPRGASLRARAYSCLASLQIHGGHKDQGLAHFRAALRERRVDARMYVELADALSSGVGQFWGSNTQRGSSDCAPGLSEQGGGAGGASGNAATLLLPPAQHVVASDVQQAVWHLRQALMLQRSEGAAVKLLLPVLCRLGWLHLSLGSPEDAMGAFEEAARLGVQDGAWDVVVEARAGLGRAHMWSGHFRQACDEYRVAAWIASGAAMPAPERGGVRLAATTALAGVAGGGSGDGSGDGSPGVHVGWHTKSLLGWQLREEGMYNESVAVLASAVAGCLVADKTGSGGSSSAASRSMRRHEQCFQPHMALGTAQLDAGRLPDASRTYEKVLRAYTSQAHLAAAANNLGVCLLRCVVWCGGDSGVCVRGRTSRHVVYMMCA